MNLQKYFLILIVIFCVAGCGKSVSEDQAKILEERLAELEAGLDSTIGDVSDTAELLESGKCSIVESNEDQATLQCNDGTSYIIKNGEKGETGLTGNDGQDGANGSDGRDGDKGDKGDKGDTGLAGNDGANGQDGYSCKAERVVSIDNTSNGVLVTCGGPTNTTTALIHDGEAGISGLTGFENPCGVNGRFDEVLLRMSDGSLIAHFASGNKQFLTLLGPGNYKTTDGYSCNFSVNSDLEISSTTTTQL